MIHGKYDYMWYKFLKPFDLYKKNGPLAYFKKKLNKICLEIINNK